MKYLKALGFGVSATVFLAITTGIFCTFIGLLVFLIKFAPLALLLIPVVFFAWLSLEVEKDEDKKDDYSPKNHIRK